MVTGSPSLYRKNLEDEIREERLSKRNKERLRATGVVEIFEALRDSEVLKCSDQPEMKVINSDGVSFWVDIAENEGYYGPATGRETRGYSPAMVSFNKDCSSV